MQPICPRQADCDWQTTDQLTHTCQTCGLTDHQATRLLRAWYETAKRRLSRT